MEGIIGIFLQGIGEKMLEQWLRGQDAVLDPVKVFQERIAIKMPCGIFAKIEAVSVQSQCVGCCCSSREMLVLCCFAAKPETKEKGKYKIVW
ncbi:MAG: hypothetical protein V2I36_09545 [Desulfopila sp.]|jgi:hypothetical protein|nr:hypothetical protein [Desulfopila sp.]